jgi:G3E family GTPase
VLDACATHAPRLDLRAGSALGAVLGMQQMGKRTSKPSQAVAHDRIFAQATLHQSRPISFQELEAAFKSLPVGVIRAKGFLALLDHDRPWLLQKVGRRLDIAEAVGVAPEIEKAIVLIGDSDVFRAADALNLLGFSRSGRRRIEASEA